MYQQKFALMVAHLILYAESLGYGVTFGDAYRDARWAGAIGKPGVYGHPNSYHKKRLAVDLNLFKDGEYLAETSDHKPLGLYWESMGGTWGGRFEDGNHYSLGETGR